MSHDIVTWDVYRDVSTAISIKHPRWRNKNITCWQLVKLDQIYSLK